MAHSYAHLYGLAVTGLRFFTVYGPWGRPDMAYWIFTEAIWNGTPIQLNNNGRMLRDFTYIDDVVDAVIGLIPRPASPDPDFDRSLPCPSRSWAPFRLYNLGATHPESLEDMVSILEAAIGRAAIRRYRPMQPGDVAATYADMTDLQRDAGFKMRTPLKSGLVRFVDWYRAWRSGSLA